MTQNGLEKILLVIGTALNPLRSCVNTAWKQDVTISDRGREKMKGYNERTGVYTSRYYANKAKHGGEVVVKVCGGYSIMTATNYQVWKKQK